MRFVFVNRFYWPEEPATAQLLADLSEALVAAGHPVSVIARRPQGAAPGVKIRHGVTIRRVRATRWGHLGPLGKATDFATYAAGGLFRLLVSTRRGDIVVVLTDPPLLGLAVWLTARLRRARIVHWVQDIYPEIAIAVAGQHWLAAVKPLRNLAWRRADACVLPGEDMARVVAGAGVAPDRVTVIPNWAPAGLSVYSPSAVAALRADWDLTEKFVLLYSGNLGRVHDLMPLLEVAGRLRDRPRFVLLFVGAGAQLATLREAVASRELPNVRFKPPQSRELLATSLAVGDLHAVTVLPGCEAWVFPSKLYGAAAVGRPVIFIGPPRSEIASQILRHGWGFAFARDETDRIAESLRRLESAPAERDAMSQAALAFSRAAGGPDEAARRWAALAATIGSH